MVEFQTSGRPAIERNPPNRILCIHVSNVSLDPEKQVRVTDADAIQTESDAMSH